MKKVLCIIILLSFSLSCGGPTVFVRPSQLDQVFETGGITGAFQPVPNITLSYIFTITPQGNGNIVFGSYGIRIYDEHDDGLIFKGGLLNQQRVDINKDGLLDLVFTGTAVITDEDGGPPLAERPIRSVFLYHPGTMSFVNSEPDDAVVVYPVKH